MGISLLAYAEKTTRTAEVLEVQGNVMIIPPEGKTTPAKAETIITVGDTLKTQAKSYAVLQFDGAETVTIDMYAGSELLFSEFTRDNEKGTQLTLLDITTGKILVEAQEQRDENSTFQIRTPTSIVEVTNAAFVIEVETMEK